MLTYRVVYCFVLLTCVFVGRFFGGLDYVTQGIQQLYAITLSLVSLLLVFHRARADRAPLISCFTAAVGSAIWFLYLEGILPSGDAWQLPANQVIKALSYSPFFLLVFVLCYRPRGGGKVYRLHDKFFLRVIPPSILPLAGVILTVVTFIVVLARYDFDWEFTKQVYLAGREGGQGIIRRGGIGGWEVFLQPLEFMLTAVPTIAALTWVQFPGERRPSLGWRFVSSLCAAFIVFVAFLNGSRGLLATFVAGPAAVWLLFGKRLPRVVFFSASAALFLLLIGVWEYQERHRSNLLRYGSMKEMVKATTFDPTESHRDNNLYVFTLHVMYQPTVFPFDGFYEFYMFAVNPIPRAIWKGKPKGIQEDETTFSTVQGPASMGPITMGTASLSASIIADGYKMYHYYGIALYAAIMGFGASFWDELARRRLLVTKLYFILNAAWLFWFLWGFRSAFAYVTGMYSVWGCYLICGVLGASGSRLVFRSPNQRNASRSAGQSVKGECV